uniref:Calmodulin like 6 n=1 Tax=Prolemur simus TaxID=1328070 RepID=A0A8C8ZPN5_PROSS
PSAQEGLDLQPQTSHPLPARCPLQMERLSAEQIKEYKGVFEMFDEEGNREVKMGELERLMSLLGMNPTKSERASMAKDVGRDSERRGAAWAGLALPREGAEPGERAVGGLPARTRRYVLMNAGEPLNEVEAEQMVKEADKDRDGTIDYEGEWFVAIMTGESFKLVQ